MNGTVRKVVCLADLPEGLRDGFDPARPVEIVQRAEAAPRAGRAEAAERVRHALEHLRAARGDQPSPFRSMDDVVNYVRAVRDGGDLSKWLGDPPISTPTRS